MSETISAIIPVLNEARALPALIQALRMGGLTEVVVADGGSSDASAAVAEREGALLVAAPRGRAAQMNAGAEQASGDCLWFVHADTLLHEGHVAALGEALAQGAQWGRFDVRLSGERAIYGVIGRSMNLRSRLTGIATGDQAIFIRRALFAELGGYPAQPLMEDVELSARLKRRARPMFLTPPVVTSVRRWEQGGVWRTIVLMWRLRYAYWRGRDPAELHARYYGDAP